MAVAAPMADKQPAACWKFIQNIFEYASLAGKNFVCRSKSNATC